LGVTSPAESDRASRRSPSVRRRRRGVATGIYVLAVFAATIAVFAVILRQSTNLTQTETALASVVHTTRRLDWAKNKLEGQLKVTDAILAQSALGETDSAIALADRAAKADPKDARFGAIAADLRLRRGTDADVRAARNDFQRVQSADPRSPLVISVAARLNASSNASVKKEILEDGQRSATELAVTVAKETTRLRDSLTKKPDRVPKKIDLKDIEFLPQSFRKTRLKP